MVLLKKECFGCHNQEKKKGGLILTSRERLLEGGQDGAVVVPGKPDASLLAKALRAGADPHMPPKKQLADPQIKLIRDWIKSGLAWNDAALKEEEPITPVQLRPLPSSYQPVLALALSRDNRKLAVGRGGQVVIYEAGQTNFPVLQEIDAHNDAVQALAWSPDGTRLVSGGFRRLVLWSGNPLKLEHEWTDDLVGRITALRFLPEGDIFVAADAAPAQNGFLRIFAIADGKAVGSWQAHADTIFDMDLSRDGNQLVTAGGDKLIKVWELASKKEVATLEADSAQVLAVAFNTNATQVVSGGADKELRVWNIKTRERITALGKQPSSITSVAWPADGHSIFAATDGGAALSYKNLKVHSGEQSSSSGDERKLGETGDAVNCLAVASDGKQIFAGCQDGSVHVWNDAGKLLARLPAPTNTLLASAPITNALASSALLRRRVAPFSEDTKPASRHVVSTQEKPSQTPPPPVSFILDVLPALSKAGCNAGSCHAKGDGQNGFKLSVFSYDPKSDFAEIVKEDRGRRIFPAAPEESLIIKKPTTALPHEGGLRFERGSETFQLLVRWMREGMNYSLTNEPVLQSIAVLPKEGRYRKGAKQRLLVQARYSDGSIRDVTRLATFDSNDKDIAKVDELGHVSIGTLTGQGVVIVRYMGLVTASEVFIPADHLLPQARYTALPKNNFIDELAYAHFQQLGLFPSDLCTETEFLRRAKLDAIGLLPTPDEVRSLLESSQSDERARRRALIDRFLDNPAYADFWANKWADLLRPNPDRVGVKSVFILDQWLRDCFRQNKPYDQFVREILLAEGSTHRDGPSVIYRDRREPPELTTMFSQLFLGTRLECAKCHHHPNEKWSQNDFYQFAAFFGPVKQRGAGLSPPISGGKETFYFASGAHGVKHPVTGDLMSPRPLDGPPVQGAPDIDPRVALADWLTAPENPFFARAAVNRVWAAFFGRGLVEPVDDFRVSNPCVNPALLSALAEDFAKQGYDLKRLMRTIMESRLYQLSSIPNKSNLADTRNFSRAYRRRLPAEVFLDAVNDVTGARDTFAAMPIGSRATQAWSYKIESQFMDAFNRPNPSSDPPCERDRQLSVVQSLHLMNSKALQAKLGSKTGRARRLAESAKSPEEVVTELYLATVSRPPTEEELKLATAVFNAKAATRQSATEDVLWALLNSAEFVFNH